MRRLIAIADDLSGAAETAAKFIGHSAQIAHNNDESLTFEPRIVLLGDDLSALSALPAQIAALVVDTDNRHRTAGQGRARLAAVLDRVQLPAGDGDLSGKPVIFLKVDSLLRGNVADQLELLAGSGMVVLAPALPELGRHTLGGTVVCDGIPLADTDLWRAEGRSAPATIADVLDPLKTKVIGLADVRSDAGLLARRMAPAGSARSIVVCDAETQADLNAIAAAALSLDGVRLAGSSALGAAIGATVWASGRTVPSIPAAGDPRGLPMSVDEKVCVVVGTASSQGQTQVALLASAGLPVISLDPEALLQGSEVDLALRTALAAGTAVVSLGPATVVPESAAMLAQALARFVVPHLDGHRLVLTGGETARAVLDALGAGNLRPLFEIEHGAILSQTDDGIFLVTRPGSFGNDESLLTILDHLSTYALPDRATLPSGQGKGIL